MYRICLGIFFLSLYGGGCNFTVEKLFSSSRDKRRHFNIEKMHSEMSYVSSVVSHKEKRKQKKSEKSQKVLVSPCIVPILLKTIQTSSVAPDFSTFRSMSLNVSEEDGDSDFNELAAAIQKYGEQGID